MGATRQHDLFTQRFAFAFLRQFGILLLKYSESLLALVRIDIRHEAARIVQRPVIAEDEARLHAVRLDFLKQDGVRFASIDAHARAKRAFLDAVLNRGRASFKDGLEIPKSRRFIGFCSRFGHLAFIERSNVIIQSTFFVDDAGKTFRRQMRHVRRRLAG